MDTKKHNVRQNRHLDLPDEIIFCFLSFFSIFYHVLGWYSECEQTYNISSFGKQIFLVKTETENKTIRQPIKKTDSSSFRKFLLIIDYFIIFLFF